MHIPEITCERVAGSRPPDPEIHPPGSFWWDSDRPGGERMPYFAITAHPPETILLLILPGSVLAKMRVRVVSGFSEPRKKEASWVGWDGDKNQPTLYGPLHAANGWEGTLNRGTLRSTQAASPAP